MIERVRAILVTDDERLLVIKRTRPGTPTYWVLPGGHVEPGDADLEAALHRELHEELAGDAAIHALVQILDGEDGSDRQYFYLRAFVPGDSRTAPARSSPTRIPPEAPTSSTRSLSRPTRSRPSTSSPHRPPISSVRQPSARACSL
jgi:ADP-ribose pyrophosphatase YjhB (NUDIX family)